MNLLRPSLAVLATLLFCGCGATKFSPAESTVMSKSVFKSPSNEGDAANGTISQVGGPASGQVSQPPGTTAPGTAAPSNGSVAQPINGAAAIAAGLGALAQLIQGDLMAPIKQLQNTGKTPLSYTCPSGMDNTVEPLLKSFANPQSTYEVKVNGASCSTDSAKILAQLKAKVLDLKALCPALVSQITSVALYANGKLNTQLPNSPGDIQFLSEAPADLGVFYQDLPNNGIPAAACNGEQADPLVIHVGHSSADVLTLSDRLRGVYFDILGRLNNYHVKRISWFTSNEYGLLALPNANGQVRGIDELFGDHTFGPDANHPYAANGYAALAKFDANHDGRIDARDPVFPKLRVWIDRDRDGIASPSELTSLADQGIAYIDLRYTNQFRETDEYGNTANNKSIVGRTNGSLDIVFDLWFAYR